MSISNQNVNFEQLMLSSIFDKVAWLCWANTKDGQNNRRKPENITEKLLQKRHQNEIVAFDTSGEFELKKSEILRKEA